MTPKVKQFYFYSNEEHRIHIHYKEGRNKVKIWIEPEIEIAKNNGFKQHELNRILKEVSELKNEIITRWTKHDRDKKYKL